MFDYDAAEEKFGSEASPQSRTSDGWPRPNNQIALQQVVGDVVAVVRPQIIDHPARIASWWVG